MCQCTYCPDGVIWACSPCWLTLWGEAGTDQITLNATFSDPTSGAVKINWSAN